MNMFRTLLWLFPMIMIIEPFVIKNLKEMPINEKKQKVEQIKSTSQNHKLKVFIIAGQSNAVGYSNIEEYQGDTEYLQKNLKKLTKILFWPGSNAKQGFANTWTKLQVGVSEISEIESFKNGCFGPEIGFGLSLSKTMRDDEIAIIKYAVGGTGIARSIDYQDYIPSLKGFNDKGKNWYPPVNGKDAGLLYENLMLNIRNALNALKQEGRNYEILGFIWIQGEHEAGISKKMALDYGKLLTLFKTSVRNDLNIKDLPFIIGEVNSHTWAYGEIVRENQASVCQKDPNSLLIKTIDLSRNGVGGAAHFDANGMLTLGNRLAEGMLRLLGSRK